MPRPIDFFICLRIKRVLNCVAHKSSHRYFFFAISLIAKTIYFSSLGTPSLAQVLESRIVNNEIIKMTEIIINMLLQCSCNFNGFTISKIATENV